MKKKLLVFLLLSLPCISSVHAQIITTIAGTYVSSHAGDGGPATSAAMVDPFAVAVDSRGNVYVSEYSNFVRKIDRNGIITTVVGAAPLQPPPYGDGGPATAAYLDKITDLAFDAADNLYVVDHGHACIRKVDKAGIITTIAGGGSSLTNGIPATDAVMLNVNGITVDPAGNIYLCDKQLVRKVNTAGYISTIAGKGSIGYSGDGGPALAAEITFAYDVALDKAGNVYFSDWKDYSIRKISTTGIITTIAGDGTGVGGHSGDGGPATAAIFESPWGIAMDDNDNLFICDALNGVVRKIDLGTGIITHVAGVPKSTGSYGDGGPAATAGCGSRNLAIDCGNNLFLANYLFVRKVTYTHVPVFTVTDSLITCQNYAGVSADTLLRVFDQDITKPISWTVEVAPTNGAIGGSGATTPATGGLIVPSGIVYTPTPGYSGVDSFTIQAGYCRQVADWHKVYVRVKPSPVVAVISAPDTLCAGLSFIPTNATSGGDWTMSNYSTAIMTTDGMQGMVPGIDTLYYTVMGSNACSTAVAHKLTVINCPVGVKTLASVVSDITVYPNPAGMQLNVDGLKAAAHYRLLSVVGTVMNEGTLTAGKNTISLSGVSDGMYMLEVADPASGLTITKKIIKGE
ncbi:MAG: Leucinerich repeat protein-like protein [Flavipsychrobacter sp.]|nr:Leucinerich repeat protein-like protein [Flavipsychrobacter sp.]